MSEQERRGNVIAINPSIKLPLMEGRRMHTCSICQLVDVWGPTWQWYGSYMDIEDGRPVTKTCSEACRKELYRQNPRMERSVIDDDGD